MARERPRLIDELTRAAAAWQANQVVPRCARCAAPCCLLASVVLDLDWRRLRALYRIDEPQRAFDLRLAAGDGPAHIRKQGRRYYAHGQPCPAYDVVTKRCSVYLTGTKPPSCSEFPVYRDGDGITADRRCEAVDLPALQRHLEAATGVRLRAVPDPQFPELVALVPAPARARAR